MGIVKVRRWGPGSDNHAQTSCISTLDELVQGGGLLLGNDHGNDSDDCELPEVDCEIVMIGDQICNVPYELYDLPDLKEILSLETWNSCLTEEERFSLAAYLPDTDQQTLWITMNEMLSGKNVFFGSPLEELFQRLKGGFYGSNVSRFRETLHFLQRRKHYHSLRSYHENMAKTFMDMGRAWRNCQPTISVDERLHVWNSRKDQRPVLLVDLNAFPADGEVLGKGDKKVGSVPMFKKKRRVKSGGVCTDAPPVVMNSVTSAPITKAKGVLKLKPVEKNSVQNHIVQQLPGDSWGPFLRAPKGVLKIKPKSDNLGQQERPRAIPILPEQSSVYLPHSQKSRFSPSYQFASSWDEENLGKQLPFLHQEVRDGKTFRRPELPDLIKYPQRGEFMSTGSGPIKTTQSYQRKVKLIKDAGFRNAAEAEGQTLPLKSNHNPRIYSHETGGIGQCRNVNKLWQNSSQRSRVLSTSSAESYPFTSERYQGRRQMTPAHPIVSETVSRISAVGTENQETFLKSSDKLEFKHRDHIDGGFGKQSGHSAVSGVSREGHMFPITYKRKKSNTKPNIVDSLKPPTTRAGFESTVQSSTDDHLLGKIKPVRIRVKGWKDYNGKYKQGLANGLQHGSPA